MGATLETDIEDVVSGDTLGVYTADIRVLISTFGFVKAYVAVEMNQGRLDNSIEQFGFGQFGSGKQTSTNSAGESHGGCCW